MTNGENRRKGPVTSRNLNIKIDVWCNKYSLKETIVYVKLRSIRSSLYGHEIFGETDFSHTHIYLCMQLRQFYVFDLTNLKVQDTPRKKWMDCVIEDMARMEVSSILTSDRAQC